MFCSSCGEKIDDTSKVCAYCGAKVTPIATKNVEEDYAPKEDKNHYQPKPAVSVNPTKVQVAPEDSSSSGIISWMMSSYHLIALFSLILGLIGISPVNEIYFRTNSFGLVTAAGIMFGTGEIMSNLGIPIILTYLVPLLLTALVLIFGIIQFAKNPKRIFSIVTLVYVVCITAFTIAMIAGGYMSIINSVDLSWVG